MDMHLLKKVERRARRTVFWIGLLLSCTAVAWAALPIQPLRVRFLICLMAGYMAAGVWSIIADGFGERAARREMDRQKREMNRAQEGTPWRECVHGNFDCATCDWDGGFPREERKARL